MSFSVLARSPALRQQAIVRARAFHASGPTRSAHGDYHVCSCFPLYFPRTNLSAAFAIRLAGEQKTLFRPQGFCLPHPRIFSTFPCFLVPAVCPLLVLTYITSLTIHAGKRMLVVRIKFIAGKY